MITTRPMDEDSTTQFLVELGFGMGGVRKMLDGARALKSQSFSDRVYWHTRTIGIRAATPSAVTFCVLIKTEIPGKP